MKNTIEKKLAQDTKKLAEDAKQETKNDSRFDINDNMGINAIPDIVDDFLINTDTYELWDKFDILPLTQETIEERTESKLAETLGSNTIDFGPKAWVLKNIQLGKTILHFRRKREDYKIRVTDIDIEYKPEYILFTGKWVNNKIVKEYPAKIARNFKEWTWYFL